ncbi:MAG: Na+/H+ antiporter, partial [Sinobacteraceae bacterium]|nr:Na+/H+ antiporter [Nevskiaceae bacterium]
MGSIEIVLAMALAVVVSGYLVRVLPVSFPLPIVQIALGGVITGVFHHGVTLNPEVFFLLFLPPLLFLDGWQIPKDGLFRDKAQILHLSLGLVFFTVVVAGFLIHWLIPAMPLAVAFALAAILSPTDPVAVSAIAARAPVPKRLMHILEGESLLNDASGLVSFQFALAAAITGVFSLKDATLTFLWVALAGLACGVVFTLAVAALLQFVTRRFGEESGASILVNLLIPFGAYLLAERIHASGILAAVAAGITMSYVEMTGRSLATTRLTRSAVWDTIQFTLNGIIFVLLGEQLPGIVQGAITTVTQIGHRSPWWLIVYAIAITAILALLRFAWVWLSVRLNRSWQRHYKQHAINPSNRLIAAMSLAGVRGSVTLAGILTLPLLLPDGSPFPARNVAIFLAAVVILLSLSAASIGLPRLLKDLKLPTEPDRHQEEDDARQAGAKAALESVRKLLASLPEQSAADEVDLYADAASRVLANYQKRVANTTSDSRDAAAQLRKADAFERRLRLAGLQSERETFLSLARQRRISDHTLRRLVREVDLMES